MPNFWTITTQKIAEAFSGPRTKDVEFDQKVQEMLIIEKSILGLKAIFQNFVNYTSDKSSSFGALGNDICECHSQIEKSYEEFITAVNDINLATNQWVNIFSQAKNAIEKREESRKVYDHYDEKMEKLYRSRQEKIRKNISENPKDYEQVLRNEQKYKKATEEYIGLSVTAYEFINNTLNTRYETINPILAKFIELENKFYQSVYNSFRALENVDYKFKLAAKKYVKTENKYNPAKYIRGGDIIQGEKNNEQPKPDNKPRSRSTLTDRSQGNSTSRSREITEFDQIENKFMINEKKTSHNIKQSNQIMQEPDQTEVAENIQNPYAQINLNSSISFAKNKYQQQQSNNKRSSTPNAYIENNIQNNNFDFVNPRSSQVNNQFDYMRASNASSNMNYGNINPVNNYQNFNFNQNNNSNYNQNHNFIQNSNNNNKKVNNFDFGLIDFTNTNNLQQNMNNMNNAFNFYQNNQSQIHNFGNTAMNMNNNLNSMGITTGIPTTNLKIPNTNNKQNNQMNKNDDIFKDFFR